MDQNEDRLPLPSEDEGDLVEEPQGGMTDDAIVATEEGVPYTPPTSPVISATGEPGGPEVAGTAPTDAGELERADTIQQPDPGSPPADDELAADVIAALRDSDVPAGDRIRVAATGSTVVLRGSVESIDILEEVLGIAGDVDGVEEVVDQMEVTRA